MHVQKLIDSIGGGISGKDKSKHPFFEIPKGKASKGGTVFTVKHYAAPVRPHTHFLYWKEGAKVD